MEKLSVHLNLISESADDTLVLTKISPPYLVLLGPVNKMFDELCKMWPDCEDLWMKPMYIKREGYHGGSVNGNDSKTLLKNVDIVDHVQDTLDDM